MKRNILFSVLFLFMIHPIIDMLFAGETQKKPLICILFGPPGVGQGDLASRTSEVLSMPLVSTAKLTLHYLKEDSPLGKQIKHSLSFDQKIPDDLLLEMLCDFVQKNPSANGYVIDGLLRTPEQAKKMREKLNGAFSWLVLYIDVKDETLIQRAVGRRVCSHCGIVYHLEDSPPEKPMECDKCHSPLIFRDDDKPENVQKRLSNFHTMMNPLKTYFEKEGIFLNIDGNKYVGPTFLDGVFVDISKDIEMRRELCPVPVGAN